MGFIHAFATPRVRKFLSIGVKERLENKRNSQYRISCLPLYSSGYRVMKKHLVRHRKRLLGTGDTKHLLESHQNREVRQAHAGRDTKE